MNSATAATAANPAEQRLGRLQQFLLADPGNEPLRADIFQLALQLGQSALAQAQVAYQLEQDPLDVNWRHRQAALAMQRHDYGDAVQLLAALALEAEGNPYIRLDLGRALFRQGEFELALAQLQPLVDTQLQQVPGALGLWMRCQQQLGELDLLLDVFAARAADTPLPPEAWGLAGLIAVDAERVDEARAWAGHALQIAPQQREALVAMGTLAIADQDAATAQRLLQACVALHPQDGRAWSALGMARMLEGEMAPAQDALRLAVQYMPSHIGTWHALGWSQLSLLDLAAAKASFAHALEMDHNFGESHGGLALVLAVLGEREAARFHLERALRLDQGSLAALYARAVLSGEGGDPQTFRVMARRILGKQKTLTGAPLADAVLARMRS
jgi:tetratricopeptide (TPR) repeat protein